MRKLKIWIIAEGETMPEFGDVLPDMKNARRMRAGMLAKYMSAKGHDVTWWSSTFDHYSKSYYCNAYREIQVNPNEKLILLHSPTAYKRNISPTRIIYSRNLGREFLRHSEEQAKPDIIFCCLPLPEFVKAAVTYGKKHNVPVIVDVRDFWPDIYYRAVPKVLQPLAKIAIHFMRKSIGRTMAQAAGITGITPIAMEWGCKTAGREPGKNDRVMFISNEVQELSAEDMAENLKWWEEQGITGDTWNMCFFGMLSIHSEIGTVIEAVKRLADTHKDIRLIIGGAGDKKEDFMKLADGCSNILFSGFLNHKQMNSLMHISKLGVYSIKNSYDFTNTLGNKVTQYCSCSMPILNSLTGYVRTLLEQEHCGLTYREGDPEDCAAKILQLYNDEPDRRTMAANAHAVFMRKFEAGIVHQQYEDYFHEIVNNFGKENDQ